MKARENLLMMVEKWRRLQKAGEFINISKNSIRLFGKTPEMIMSCRDKKKLHEIILIPNEFNVEHLSGDAVTPSDVFLFSENVVWEDDSINFKTDEGVLVSANQFEYIQKHGSLMQYHYFGRSNNKDTDIMRVWKEMTRKSSEARKDKAKEILNMTIGTVTWTKVEASATKPAERVKSPLLICQIIEAPNSKDRPRFNICTDTVKINGILQRELRQKNINLFLDISMEQIMFGQPVLDVLNKIVENAKYCHDIEINLNEINICTLDSTNETICQYVEKHIDELANSPLIQVLLGDKKYEDLPICPVASFPIYPLPTDDSQRNVVQSVMDGHSMNVSAAAGTGKSHIMVLLAANLIVAGLKVCVMSEKQAANEVFLRYAKNIGIEQFCLEIKSKMTVAEIIDQLDKIRNMAQVYVDPVKARDLLSEIAELEELFDKYNDAMYLAIPGLDISLYNLIGESIEREQCLNLSSLNVEQTQYRTIVRKLETLQKDINNTVSVDDFNTFLKTGKTGDEETDELLIENIDSLKKLGVDVVKLVQDNAIDVSDIATTIRANIARIIANRIINENSFEKFGNVFLRSKYAKLVESYTKLEVLSADYIKQQVSARVVKAVSEDKELIPLLERIKTSRMSVQTFFKKYGSKILQLCPIIVTTPSAAINYMTEEMNIFDKLLIDEASQVPIISVVPFLVGNRQLIAFGDNMQLDLPTAFQSEDEDVYDENGEFDLSRTDKSILHLVQGKGIPSERLLGHYRSKTQHNITVSNKLCYNSMLNITPDIYTGWDKLPDYLRYEINKIVVPFDIAKAQASIIPKQQRFGAKNSNRYIESYIEQTKQEMAKSIADRVGKLKEENEFKSIGVVTLNDAFHDIVMDELEERLPFEDTDCEKLWVRSIENVQGKEADIIIIAIDHARRNAKGVLQKNISGYFHGAEKGEQSGNNRLNVLFTRAREKNIIYLAFDYSEIKDTERSLKRLYTYLEYAATGNMSCVKDDVSVVDKTNEHTARVIKEALNGKIVRTKIGSNSMMVDLGVLDTINSEKFSVGFLMPDRKISTNMLCTKINLLERAGWRILPLSVVYLLDKTEAIKNQLPKMIANNRKLGCNVNENFITISKPIAPITLDEIAMRSQISDPDFTLEVDKKDSIQPLSVQDFTLLNIEQTCRDMCNDFKYSSQDVIDNMYKTNTQALLIKLAQVAHKSAQCNDIAKLNALANKVYFLYQNRGEKRAGYLLSQLLRLSLANDDKLNVQFIQQLINEAETLNFFKETR